MVNYQNGKIYKIVCDETGYTYYGSTVQRLTDRLSGHKSKINSMVKYMINPKIYLIEDYPCERKEQLLMRERFYIENNECINRQIPLRTNMERYYDNKEIICEKQKLYYQKIKLEKNKKFTCECGGKYTKINKNKHLLTKKHQDLKLN